MAKRGRPASGITLGIGFPERLSQLRLALEPVPTQKELAQEIGLSRAYYSSMEAGSIASPSESILRRIAKHFDIGEVLTMAREPDEPPLPPKQRDYKRGHTTNSGLMNVGRDFPKRLYETRWGMRLTQKEFGDKVGLGMSTVNRLERGLRLPTENSFYLLVEATERDAGWWYGRPNEQKLMAHLGHS